MKARKVAILLAVAAVSVVTLFVITLIDDTALGATSSSWSTADPDSALAKPRQECGYSGLGGVDLVEVLAVPVEGEPGDLLAPFTVQDGRDFRSPSSPVVDCTGN